MRVDEGSVITDRCLREWPDTGKVSLFSKTAFHAD